MLEWIKNLDPRVQAAIIAFCATILAALVAGMFSLIKRGKGSQGDKIIKQKQGIGNKGIQIGIQNNYGSCESIKGEEKNE